MSVQFPLPAFLLLLLLSSSALAAPTTATASAGAARPQLSVEGSDAAAGYLTLTWSGGPEAAEYQVEASDQADFSGAVVRYQGQQTATVRSGLTDGAYHYRVRARAGQGAEWGPWSEPVQFDVAHHSLSLALSLLGVGALVFVGTLSFLLIASRKVETRG